MKYSYNWLKELSGTKLPAEKAAELLTMHSFELEGIEKGEKGDKIFEIKVLPDRSHDAMSYVGVARELAVLNNIRMPYDFEGGKISKKISNKLDVEIQDKKLCQRYIGAVMENIKIQESPQWMQERLKIAGINIINNVVDATNYVMLELGQPMHAFDFDKLKSQNIVVRKAKNKEKIILLDGSEINLADNNLLITNGENSLAIAGIKGGKAAEIDNNTKTIILEAANFDAVNIRKSRMRLNIKTESSDRFEKEIDPNLAEKAMARVIEILEHTAGAKLEGMVDIYPNKIKPWKIKLDLSYANKLLGEKIPAKNIIKILNLLSIKTKAGKLIECEIPTFRIDLKTQEDLAEEIGRIWGYEKIKPEPLVEPVIPAEINRRLFFERKVKNILSGIGFDEMYNYSFYSESDIASCGLEKQNHLELTNPMNPEQQFVRASMIPNILKNIRENLKNFSEFEIFEIGRTYSLSDKLPKEKRNLIMAQVLEKDPVNSLRSHGANKNADTFFELKGAVENFLESLGIKNSQFSNLDIGCPSMLHKGRAAEIKINGENVGIIAEVNPQVLGAYKIKNRAAIAEFDLEKLLQISQKEKTYQPISKFPIITRDISLLTGESNTAEKIINQIKKIGGNFILSVEVFDVFKKDNKTSLAFHITLGANRTLENSEADEIMGRIISGLEKELKIEVRK